MSGNNSLNGTITSYYNKALSSHMSKGPLIVETSTLVNASSSVEIDRGLSRSGALPAKGWREELFDFVKELIIFTKNRSWKKKLLTFLIVASSFYVVIDLIWLGHVQEWITDCVSWLSWHPAWAVILFLLLFVACTFLFVPPAFLYFGAGYAFTQMTENMAFGMLAAAIVAYLGSLLGAILAFYRARYMMRDVILLFARRFPIIRAADQAFARDGFRVMLLLRLCPIIPFNGLNYIGGVLSVSADEFTRALIGIVPTMLLWIYCGASSRVLGQARLSAGGDGVQMSWVVLLGSGIGFGIIALILTWRMAIKELSKEIAVDSAENWFRYKRQNDELEKQHLEEGFEIVASQRMLDIEQEEGEGLEVTHGVPVSFHRRVKSSILPLVGIDTHHLDDHFDPPIYDEDEDWLWLFA